MLTIRNNSNTLVIVLHEIYGINQHIKGVCEKIAELGYDVVCPDLLDGKPSFAYEQEEEAYQYFLNFAGFEPSSKRITFLLRQEKREYQQIILLGYSVGATIAWLCSEKLEHSDGVVGFYGSRIRDYMGIVPKCPVLLFFPENEKSFDPAELQNELLKKQKVTVHIFEGNHGFADSFSERFDERSGKEAIRLMEEFLKSPDHEDKE